MFVGQKGLSPAVLESVREALDQHELIKVKFDEFKEQKKELAPQLAEKTGRAVSSFKKLVVWGNHSPTMYADYRFATIGGAGVKDMIADEAWNADTFLPTKKIFFLNHWTENIDNQNAPAPSSR